MSDDKDTRVPTLAMVGGDAPSVIGTGNYIGMDKPEPSKTPSDEHKRPYESQLLVATSDLRGAEQAIIANARDVQVPKFEEFKKKVLEEEKWVFLVSDPHDMEVYHHDGRAPKTSGSCSTCGGVTGQVAGDYADFTDPNPAKTQETIDGQHALLRAVGDSIEAIGHFSAMLNNAAQLYALADENSYPPTDSVTFD